MNPDLKEPNQCGSTTLPEIDLASILLNSRQASGRATGQNLPSNLAMIKTHHKVTTFLDLLPKYLR
jgi:hypothetical protein